MPISFWEDSCRLSDSVDYGPVIKHGASVEEASRSRPVVTCDRSNLGHAETVPEGDVHVGQPLCRDSVEVFPDSMLDEDRP